MPELPEVETTRRGILPVLAGHRIKAVTVRQAQLRWPVPGGLAKQLIGQRIHTVNRRGKYLLIELQQGTLIWHLGMSGSLRIAQPVTVWLKHDHIELVLDSDRCIRFNDPRRFGSVHYALDPQHHPLLRQLGPEPLTDTFDGAYLATQAKGRRVALKPFIMNAHTVVGVGNIYANEALFHARLRPQRLVRRVRRTEFDALAQAIKTVLHAAIQSGGTTLRDYVDADGMPGYFSQQLYVYERAGQPCSVCGTLIKHRVQGQRSTYYCPQCQR